MEGRWKKKSNRRWKKVNEAVDLERSKIKMHEMSEEEVENYVEDEVEENVEEEADVREL